MSEQLQKKVLHIENLDCPVCAEALQSDLQKIKGVESVSVDYVTQTITLQTRDEKAVQKVIAIANRFEEVRVIDGDVVKNGGKKYFKEWFLIALSAVFFAIGVLFERYLQGRVGSVFAYAAYAIAYFSVGYPVLISTVKNVAKGRIFDENFLMTIASIGAVALGEIGEGVLVMLLYQLGELLQSIAVGSSRASVARLMDLKSEQAMLLRGEETVQVSPEEIEVGDILLVKAGEKVPVDGVLLAENALLDTKPLTGEAELKAFSAGQEVLSGCINVGNVFTIKATRKYTDSAVGRILEMVENAAENKAAPEKFITKFARYYTPIVCLAALLIGAFAPILHGYIAMGRFTFYQTSRWVQSALTFLVISCPCALIISVPLTYFSGIGACAKNGILVKGATYLDILASAKTMAFDKTGTLTKGEFSILGVYPKSCSETELLVLAATVERHSAHPIAKAFEKIQAEQTAQETMEIPGKGVKALVAKDTVFVGNAIFLEENSIFVEQMSSANTVIYVAKNGECLGAIEVGDGVRDGAKECIQELTKLGFANSVMLTGDNRIRAEEIAKETGIFAVKAGLLPDEKLQIAKQLKRNGKLVYVGDGINDAPVMVEADCAVSMGKLGSAAAIEASDLVLIADDISALPKLVRIARKTRAVVMQNIIFSIVMKLGFMLLGAFGGLPLAFAVFADVGVMLLAVCNSFRVRGMKTVNK